MKTAIKTDLKSKTFCINRNHNYNFFKEKEIGLANTKVYQKLFVVFIFLSTFLIFPESPRELENICETYNSKGICIVW
jgi:hypothetical protein